MAQVQLGHAILGLVSLVRQVTSLFLSLNPIFLRILLLQESSLHVFFRLSCSIKCFQRIFFPMNFTMTNKFLWHQFYFYLPSLRCLVSTRSAEKIPFKNWREANFMARVSVKRHCVSAPVRQCATCQHKCASVKVY